MTSVREALVNIAAVGAAIAALGVIVKLPVLRWIWRRLVKDPLNAWHRGPTEALAKDMREGRDILHKRVGDLEERVETGFVEITEQLTKHDERVTRSQTPRRATDPSDVSWEDARGEFPS